MHSIEPAIRFLCEDVGRPDLARLLRFSTYSVVQEEIWKDQYVTMFAVVSPKVYADALAGLSNQDKKRIFEALTAVADVAWDTPDRVVFHFNDQNLSSRDTLFAEVWIHRNQMIAVATGEQRIEAVNDYYKARHRKITNELATLGIKHPNPHPDLWHFYKAWKDTMGSWAERRQYVGSIYDDLIDRLLSAPPAAGVAIPEPTGWDRVDRAIAKAKGQLVSAKHEEDFQNVGLLCREVLISLGQAVFDSSVHQPVDAVEISRTDAGRMIEAFIAHVAAGSSNENIRKHVRTSLKLAVELQHGRNADFRDAALCLEATSSVTNSIAILAGRRDAVEV